MKKSICRVELLGVPDYRQGSHDSLCVYYACSMLLATAHPELRHRFGAAGTGRRSDPILSHYGGSAASTPEERFAAWFTGGAHLSKVRTALNAAMAAAKPALHTKFIHKKFDDPDDAWSQTKAAIEEGFPVVLSWNSEDIGDHAVLVVGWEKRSKDVWLHLLDPGTGRSERSLQQVKRLTSGPLELLWVDPGTHTKHRPDKMLEDAEGWWIERWWSNGSGGFEWQNLDDLFDENRPKAE